MADTLYLNDEEDIPTSLRPGTEFIVEEAMYRPDIDTSAVDSRKLMRKIDLRVIPWLSVLYFLNFMDRGNVGNARVTRSTNYPAT